MATKLISWNVNGLRAVCGKGFADIFADFDADYVCLQETKLQQGQIDLEFPGYTSYWNYAEKKGYSGVAVYTRRQPLAVHLGIGRDEHDREGRVITLEDKDFYLVCCYTPNSQNPEVQGELPKRLDYRMEWEDAFRDYVSGLHSKGLSGMVAGYAGNGADCGLMAAGGPKPVIICGDLNVAHKEIDLKNPKTNRGNPGFSDEERGKFSELLESGFTDSFRYLYPDLTDAYSWWSYRFKAREKNVGWRIDYFVVSSRIAEKIKEAKIHTEIFGSDHCPVELDIEI